VKATEPIVKYLENEGVNYIFGVPGEENMELLDALIESALCNNEDDHSGVVEN
jgi:acetolactate synthase-1/2/3 large subunit